MNNWLVVAYFEHVDGSGFMPVVVSEHELREEAWVAADEYETRQQLALNMRLDADPDANTAGMYADEVVVMSYDDWQARIFMR